MNKMRKWIIAAVAVMLPLLITLQPIVTHACPGVGSHGGC